MSNSSAQLPLSDEIDTPAVVISETIATNNVRKFQQHCDQAGLSLRPHIKTHKTLHFADKQLQAGATGITCQKLGEAEIMASGGHDDILITYNILGKRKLARLLALSEKVTKLAVTCDNLTVLDGLAKTFGGSGTTLAVMVECDTGAGRCGVQTTGQALALARKIQASDGLMFRGLMTFPKPGESDQAALKLQEIKSACEAEQLHCEVISTGGTPDMWQAGTRNIFTEYRIGTYIFNDRSVLSSGTCTEEDCAAFVLATIVSMPTPNRAVVDAGSKILTSDLFGLTGHGHVIGHPKADITNLSEEHGVIEIESDSGLQVGDQIRIIPNHICVVVNMVDRLWLQRDNHQYDQLTIDARGVVF